MIRIEEELVVNNKTIDARILSRMFLAGAKNLEAKKEWINELNVFPVPDGDTGTNMTMTIMAAAAEVGSLGEPDMESLAKAISSGSLRGARGNSGVILSQLLLIQLYKIVVILLRRTVVPQQKRRDALTRLRSCLLLRPKSCARKKKS